MSDRPGSGGPDQGPEFGWLYGRPGAGDEEPAPEATRKIPVQPRPTEPRRTQPRPPPAATGPRPPVPAPYPPQPQYQPQPQPQPLPPQRPGRSGGGFWARRLRRPGFYLRTALVLVLLWATYIVAVPFLTWQSSDKIAYAPDGERPGEQDGTTYLLVGSDSRQNLTEAERKKYRTGSVSSELTDTMMLLHTGGGPSVLLSIPRDTRISQDAYSGRLNGAYSQGGAALLTQVIETETGIRVDKYVEIGLGGVADVVDAVGGIEVCPTERLLDGQAGLNIYAGCQEVDGATALGYSRSRKKSALGDLERVRRQREVIGAIGQKVLSPWSVLNPVRWWNLNEAVPSFFVFGEGTSAIDASRWALAMTRTGTGDNLTCTMPVTDGSAETWDRERADPMFAAIIDDQTDQITPQQCTPNGVVP